MNPPSTHPRILRLKDVIQAVGLSRSSIYRLIKLDLFPGSILIGLVARGWLAEDIDHFLIERKISAMKIQ